MADTAAFRMAQAPAVGSEDTMRAILENLPVGIWVVDRELRYTWASEGPDLRAAGIQAGDLVGTHVGDGLAPDAPAIAAHERAVTGLAVTYESEIGGRWFRCRVEPLRDARGELVGALGVALDMTDRKRAEDTLREVLRGYRAIAEITSDFAYSLRVLPGEELELEWITEGFEQLTGFSRAEINAMGVLNLVHPEDLVAMREAVSRARTGETIREESRIVTRDGETRWVRMFGAPEADDSGRVVRIHGAAQDITDHKRMEETLGSTLEELRRTDRERLRLLVHLVRAQEEERKRIAEGIHDDSIQVMATVGLRLATLSRRATNQEDRRALAELEDLVEGAVARLRGLLFDLAPPLLRDQGLAAALRHLLDKLAADHPDGLRVELDGALDAEPAEEISVLLYRIAQEALTNVRKHARASSVRVSLQPIDGGIHLAVEDDGVGLPPEERLPRPGHLGLTAMRERAEMAGGWCRIEGAPGRGTAVRCWVPLPSARLA